MMRSLKLICDKSSTFLANRTLLVSIKLLWYPITEDILNQVFSPYGMIEKITVIEANAVELWAFVRFDSDFNAIRALYSLQGRFIYEGCCLLSLYFPEVEFAKQNAEIPEIAAENIADEVSDRDALNSCDNDTNSEINARVGVEKLPPVNYEINEKFDANEPFDKMSEMQVLDEIKDESDEEICEMENLKCEAKESVPILCELTGKFGIYKLFDKMPEKHVNEDNAIKLFDCEVLTENLKMNLDFDLFVEGHSIDLCMNGEQSGLVLYVFKRNIKMSVCSKISIIFDPGGVIKVGGDCPKNKSIKWSYFFDKIDKNREKYVISILIGIHGAFESPVGCLNMYRKMKEAINVYVAEFEKKLISFHVGVRQRIMMATERGSTIRIVDIMAVFQRGNRVQARCQVGVILKLKEIYAFHLHGANFILGGFNSSSAVNDKPPLLPSKRLIGLDIVIWTSIDLNYFLVEKGIEVWDYDEFNHEISQQKLASNVAKCLTFDRQLLVNEMFGKHHSTVVITLEELSSNSAIRKKSLRLSSISQDKSSLILYNFDEGLLVAALATDGRKYSPKFLNGAWKIRKSSICDKEINILEVYGGDILCSKFPQYTTQLDEESVRGTKSHARTSWLFLTDQMISFDKKVQSLNSQSGISLSLHEYGLQMIPSLLVFGERLDWLDLWSEIELKDAEVSDATDFATQVNGKKVTLLHNVPTVYARIVEEFYGFLVGFMEDDVVTRIAIEVFGDLADTLGSNAESLTQLSKQKYPVVGADFGKNGIIEEVFVKVQFDPGGFLRFVQYWRDVIQLKYNITTVIELGMSEMAFWHFEYANFNFLGSMLMGVTIWAVNSSWRTTCAGVLNEAKLEDYTVLIERLNMIDIKKLPGAFGFNNRAVIFDPGGVVCVQTNLQDNMNCVTCHKCEFESKGEKQRVFIPKLKKKKSLPRPVHPNGLGSSPLCKTNLGKGLVLSFAASRKEPSSKDIDMEFEKNDLEKASDESEEAWKHTLDSFKEQALKMQSISKEAYEVYSKKAMVVLEETSEKLKIQAEKASHDLSVIAKEISEESKEYLATAAENSPEPVKDIVETFASSSDELNDISKVLDFYLGIPYGAILSVGGFLSFMVTGSIPAIRFGVIIGGTLLALSISSLRSWRKGEPSPLALKGQSAIATILFVRQLRLLFQRPCIGNIFMSLISGSMAAFFAYRIIRDGEQTKGSNLAEN